ncbi:MAG: HD domain-containing phosphohydrolase [Tetrasphaera sp.]
MIRTRSGAALVGVATAVALMASVLTWRGGSRFLAGDLGYLMLTFAVIVLGEAWRERVSGRPVAPLATAAALGLSLAPVGSDGEALHAGQVLVLVALAMALGIVIRRLTGRPGGLVTSAARLIGVAVAVAVARVVPIDGRPVVSWWQSPGTPLLLGALALLAVSATGVLVELGVWSALARDPSLPLSRIVADDLNRAGGIGAAMTNAAPVMVLVHDVAGAAAIPIVLLPLAMSQYALRRRESILATERETIIALSRLTDDTGHTNPGHAGRVARLCGDMGRTLSLAERDIATLERAALLHDVGQVTLTIALPDGATVLADPDSQRRIVADTVRIIERAGVQDAVVAAIRGSIVQFRMMREFGEDIPLAGRILKVANAFDDLTHGHRSRTVRSAALERIQLGLGYEYDPACVAALGQVTRTGGRAASSAVTDPSA